MDGPWQEPSLALLDLAHAHGVIPGHTGYGGGERRTDARAIVAALAALGVDAQSEERIAIALRDHEDAPWRLTVPHVLVVRAGQWRELEVHVPHGAEVSVSVELDPEAGGGERWLDQIDRYVEPRTVDGTLVGRATFSVPADLPLGWHTVVAHLAAGESRGRLVVAPNRLELPDFLAAPDSTGAWGALAQLYSVRSRASWGVGDLADLGDLGWFFGTAGADFLLINPLHAAEPVPPMSPSPYRPTTRRWVNPLYIRVEDVPEAAYLNAADRSLVDWAGEPARALSTDPGPLDRDAVWQAKSSALEVLWSAPRSGIREARFAAFREEQGTGLESFALWCALAERYQGEPWPAEALDPSSPLVAQARVELAERVDYFCWLQWIADEQLAAAQRAAKDGGMRLGIMHDLAVGVHPEGSDAWALGDVMARSVEVGAPPDMYNQQGQNWQQPPWHPRGLERVGYLPYRDMLRTILRHAGALRIDHVIGLFRLWWIPQGQPADTGVYVRYDHEALIGILCLEAHRAGVVVIGEDLGTVEPWVRDYLTERGILGTSVLWFEKTDDGHALPPERYRRLALATVNTHDLPPTAGYLADEHVLLRERLGLLAEPFPVVQQAARREREDMLALLRDRGLVGLDPSEREVVEALHRLMLQTPSLLRGLSLVDATGERRTQNQPGTDTEYPNWKVPLGDGVGQVVLLDDLPDHPRVRSLLKVMPRR